MHLDTILYRPQNSDINIANINTDSLFTYSNFQGPAIRDIIIEDIPYKIFLLPFKMPSYSETFVFAGIMQQDIYNQQVQNIPIFFLLTVIMIIAALLLALPVVKIFILSSDESVHLTDLRAIIAVIFIFPFLLTLLCTGTWISKYQDDLVDETLHSLQQNINTNFYTEIKQNIQQQKQYDNLIKNPAYFFSNSDLNKIQDSLNARNSKAKPTDIKDIIFHPTDYKLFTSLHWMSFSGNDIAAWNLTNKTATYFQLKDRTYFIDLKYNRTNLLPGDSNYFSIQPVLSRLTGEYTINIATPSSAKINDSTAIGVGLSGKLYSVYNTILPTGFGFCIIDSTGLILCHSDTARNLQENIFKESNNNYSLRTAVKHKDSILINEVSLYEHPVKMIVKPLPGLPYYLITYHEQRNGYLFIFHVIAFAFVCEVMIMVFISLFSYLAMLSSKSVGKLLFEPEKLNWLKPSADKKVYYIKNAIQLIAALILVYLISLFYSDNGYYLYTLNANFLLPLFCVTGYYLVKNSKSFIDKDIKRNDESFFKTQLRFLWHSHNILTLYILSILIFFILQHTLFSKAISECNEHVTTGVMALIVIVPFVTSLIALLNFDVKRWPGYLQCFIVSLLIAVMLISVVPVLTTVSYAFHEERKLQLQSMQADLAKKIQQRRLAINPLTWQTKLNLKYFADSVFIDSLKFKEDKGIYLSPYETLQVEENYNPVNETNLNTSLFYKTITRFLFLPPDHDEFYDDETHNTYYYWEGSFNKTNTYDWLKLYYKNSTDRRSKASFSLLTKPPKASLFKEIIMSPAGILNAFFICIFLFLFYKIIYSVSIRVFLVHFFKGRSNKDEEDPDWLKQCYKYANLAKAKALLDLGKDEAFSFKKVRNKENVLLKYDNNFEEHVLQMQFALEEVFKNIWQRCSDEEKFCLYDFAEDGFTNYKKVITLYELYNKGLIIQEENAPTTFLCMSFRNFLATKESAEEVKKYSKLHTHSSWGTFRTVFYIILIAFAAFIFITQQQATQRLITVLTSLGALLPAMLKLFDASGAGKAGGKQN